MVDYIKEQVELAETELKSIIDSKLNGASVGEIVEAKKRQKLLIKEAEDKVSYWKEVEENQHKNNFIEKGKSYKQLFSFANIVKVSYILIAIVAVAVLYLHALNGRYTQSEEMRGIHMIDKWNQSVIELDWDIIR